MLVAVITTCQIAQNLNPAALSCQECFCDSHQAEPLTRMCLNLYTRPHRIEVTPPTGEKTPLCAPKPHRPMLRPCAYIHQSFRRTTMAFLTLFCALRGERPTAETPAFTWRKASMSAKTPRQAVCSTATRTAATLRVSSYARSKRPVNAYWAGCCTIVGKKTRKHRRCIIRREKRPTMRTSTARAGLCA